MVLGVVREVLLERLDRLGGAAALGQQRGSLH
jgi:hypothetical protein